MNEGRNNDPLRKVGDEFLVSYQKSENNQSQEFREKEKQTESFLSFFSFLFICVTMEGNADIHRVTD